MFALLGLLGWDYSTQHNDGLFGNNHFCDTDNVDATQGQDDVCLGAWSQHHKYGFAFGEQAYSADAEYSKAKLGFTGEMDDLMSPY